MSYSAAFDHLAGRLAGSAAVQQWGARAFDAYLGQLSHTSRAHMDDLIERAEIAMADHVLELGCGTGGFACYVAATTGCRVTAVDFSPVAIGQARARIAAADVGDRVTFVVGDVRAAPWPGPVPDVVVAVDVLPFTGALLTFMLRVGEVLAPGGRLALIATLALDAVTELANPDELAKAYAEAGFGPPDRADITASTHALVERMAASWTANLDDLAAELGPGLAAARLAEDTALAERFAAGGVIRVLDVARPAPIPFPELRVLDRPTLRVASWPIETLDAFAAPELASEALRPDADPQAFATAHAAQLARERAALSTIACSDRFRTALVVANPQLAARWSSDPPPEQRSRGRWRRVEASVFTTLMRAAGRPTPNGAWAGVAPVSPANQERFTVAAAARAARAVPHLAGLRAVLRALAHAERYRRLGPLTLEPTLRDDHMAWKWERDAGSGREWDHLPRHPVFDLIVAALRDGPRTCDVLISTVAHALDGPSNTERTVGEIVATLLDRGMLNPDPPIRWDESR